MGGRTVSRRNKSVKTLLVSSLPLCFVVLTLGLHGAFAQTKPERQSKAVKPTQSAATPASAANQKSDTDSETGKPEDKLFKGMKYRLIGPFRGGRSLTAAGIPGDPTTYYFGATGGGVWKSTDGAMTWSPVFDKEGSGDRLAAWRSPTPITTRFTWERARLAFAETFLTVTAFTNRMDGGKTWKNIGLHDSRAIGKVIINPNNPDIVFVAALGHPFGPNTERGIFRTVDGGKTWEKVLYKDENTGGIDVAFDPHNPEHFVCGSVAGAAHFMEHGQRRPGKRAVSLERWRHHVEAD